MRQRRIAKDERRQYREQVRYEEARERLQQHEAAKARAASKSTAESPDAAKTQGPDEPLKLAMLKKEIDAEREAEDIADLEHSVFLATVILDNQAWAKATDYVAALRRRARYAERQARAAIRNTGGSRRRDKVLELLDSGWRAEDVARALGVSPARVSVLAREARLERQVDADVMAEDRQHAALTTSLVGAPRESEDAGCGPLPVGLPDGGSILDRTAELIARLNDVLDLPDDHQPNPGAEISDH